MTFEQKLKEKADAQLIYIALDKLPDSTKAKIFGEPEFKPDRQKNDCCFITLVFEDQKTGIVQKYTKTNWKTLNEAITESGGITALQNEFHIWQKKTIGKSQYARLFPTPNKKR